MRRLLCAALLVLVPALAPAARADTDDLMIYKLGDPDPTAKDYDPNAAGRFRMLADELGVSLAATSLEPPTTLGENGFAFAFEYTVAFVNGSATVPAVGGQPYWVTQGGNPSALQLPALHFRKGLPYSLEVGGKVAAIASSSMFAGTVEVKWGVLEGFRYLPDLGVRFGLTELFGQQDMNLTAGAIDISLGKEFGVAGLLTLTPYAGYTLIGVDSSSNVVVGNQDTLTPSEYDKNPTGGQILFSENTVGQNLYDRIFGGVRLRSNIVSFAVEFSWAGAQGQDALPVHDSLYQLAFSAGLTF